MEKIEHNQRNIGHSVFPALVYFCCQFFNKDNQYDNSKQKMYGAQNEAYKTIY